MGCLARGVSCSRGVLLEGCLARGHIILTPPRTEHVPSEGKYDAFPGDQLFYSRSEWMLPLRGRITYRHCRQPKLPNFLYSSNITYWRLMRRANNNDNQFFCRHSFCRHVGCWYTVILRPSIQLGCRMKMF